MANFVVDRKAAVNQITTYCSRGMQKGICKYTVCRTWHTFGHLVPAEHHLNITVTRSQSIRALLGCDDGGVALSLFCFFAHCTLCSAV